jgi:hypothetical protein
MFVFILYLIIIVLAMILIGSKLYKKYEVESHVPSRVFKRLNRFTPESIMKFGSDDVIRWSLPSFTVYMFGDDQLYVYYQYMDIVTGKIFCEGVQEYFYEDIVGITSTQETRKMVKRGGFMKMFWVTYDYLRETISVVTSGCTHSETYLPALGTSLLDTTFTGMRNLIRQKKNDK